MAHPGLEFIQFGDFWGDRRSSYPNNIFDPSQCRHQSQSPCGRDLRAFAIAQVALAPPFDFGEFGIASGFKRGFGNTNVLNDVLIAHHDRAAATAPIANSGWKGTPTLRTRIKSSGASSAAATSAATATPPRGSARIVGSWSLYPASATARDGRLRSGS
jgi:hypothetical protein